MATYKKTNADRARTRKGMVNLRAARRRRGFVEVAVWVPKENKVQLQGIARDMCAKCDRSLTVPLEDREDA